MKHGQEPSVDLYIENFKAFNEEKFRKLKSGGVLATIIGETYQEGYQGVCSRAELALVEIGFKILDVVIWGKLNQRYAPHPYRFKNSYERIIVAYKPGAEPYFKEVYRKGSNNDFKVKPTSSNGFYIAKPETCIPNVIITSVHNSKVFETIDPEFKHDAPAVEEIYRILIEAYSKSGDTILDGFVGSGTIGTGLIMGGAGRKVIGYDVDPLSIEFSQKRFEWYLNQGRESTKSNAA
jgi:DNA modification methylase